MRSKYFKLREFACNCCGKNKIDRTFVRILSAAREYSKDADGSDIKFIITSGYRCENIQKALNMQKRILAKHLNTLKD